MKKLLRLKKGKEVVEVERNSRNLDEKTYCSLPELRLHSRGLSSRNESDDLIWRKLGEVVVDESENEFYGENVSKRAGLRTLLAFSLPRLSSSPMSFDPESALITVRPARERKEARRTGW